MNVNIEVLVNDRMFRSSLILRDATLSKNTYEQTLLTPILSPTGLAAPALKESSSSLKKLKPRIAPTMFHLRTVFPDPRQFPRIPLEAELCAELSQSIPRLFPKTCRARSTRTNRHPYSTLA